MLVSTLLEILQPFEWPATGRGIFSQFQPFLRFYFEKARQKMIREAEFQPFLRFYRHHHPEIGHSRNIGVSTLLEILPDCAETSQQRLVYVVSTLLEILPLVLLVVVGF
jgi:hypothetical protein